MTARVLCCLLLLLLASFPLGPAAAAETFGIAYLFREGDPAYEPQRAYTGLLLRERKRPLPGARLAIKESRIIGRALGLDFQLLERGLGKGEEAASVIREMAASPGGPRVFLLDLPTEELTSVASALGKEDLLLFNPRQRDMSLRQEACGPNLFHTIPSEAMLSDALAQFAKARNWTRILLLRGGTEEDGKASDAFLRSAGKFGLKIVAERSFAVTNDPRRREESNIALLTGAEDYDLIYLADAEGEFGRYVPFQSYLPRPVIGSEGLIAGAWHWTWERHGAPQLNQRFDRLADRRMEDEDWAAWAAVRATVDAVTQSGARRASELAAFLRSRELTFDGYKGAPGSFRPWNNQLRQPILLHSHNAVIARAPLEGFLHRTDNLDTLGLDAPESRCRAIED